MKHLYDGLLEKQYVGNAIDELHTVKKEFSYISPQKVIWANARKRLIYVD